MQGNNPFEVNFGKTVRYHLLYLWNVVISDPLIFGYRHLDHHRLWDPNEFAVSCFKIIMYSIQVGFSPGFIFLAYIFQAHEMG